MLFASPLFLFLFLPLTLTLYVLAPKWAKNGVLLLASVLFYSWGEGLYAVLVVVSVLVNWVFGIAIGRSEEMIHRRRWLVWAIVVNIGTLAVFKYANFVVENLNGVLAALALAPITMAAIPLPLGISFFTFHAISYVVDVYKRNAHAERRLSDFAPRRPIKRVEVRVVEVDHDRLSAC